MSEKKRAGAGCPPSDLEIASGFRYQAETGDPT